jgi:acyl-CoA synthetase (NDP forming)
MTARALDRLLNPRSVAIVGLSDNSARLIACVLPTFSSGCAVFIVNPRYDRVMDRPTARSLTDLGYPVDCVLSVVGAERTVEVAEEAATLDVGGMALIANGFVESGPAGAHLQDRLRAAALSGGFAVIGPNGLGFENVPRRIRLSIANRETHRVGGLSVVSQSGAMLSGVTMTGNALGAGFNLLISSGNEAVSDTADFLDYLADDPGTTGIALVIEKIRRPDCFFAALDRAIAAGKPVVAVKLARSERTRKMAASHTGALTGDAWVYDVALKQHGVSMAYDAEELGQRLALVDKIPQKRWTPVQAMGAVTTTGGYASQAYDVAVQEGISLPDLEALLPWVRERVPGTRVANPLDTAAAGGGTSLWHEIIERYITSSEIDAFIVPRPMTRDEEGHVHTLLTDLAELAQKVRKPVVLANIAGPPPAWASRYESDAVALGSGLRPTLRGLQTIGSFVRYRDRGLRAVSLPGAVARPGVPTVRVPEGEMLPFDATMRILREAGIPVAPYVLLGCDTTIDFPEPYVVKLADVTHRTEHRAVRLGITQATLPDVAAELRQIANARGLSPEIAVQPMVDSAGEVFIGINGTTELGPMVLFGLGGIFVEALNRVGGRMAPFDLDEARDLIEEFRELKVMHGFRGRPAWDLDALAHVLVKAGDFAAAGQEWIASLDLNPVLHGGDGGYTAVDALLLIRS